jgi:DNA topoisomerase-2
MLTEKGYDILDDDEDFKYLVKMPMDSVTEENVEKLLKSKGNKELELETVKSTTIHQMWLGELDNLKEKYQAYCMEREMIMNGEEPKKKKTVIKKGGAVKKNLIITE